MCIRLTLTAAALLALNSLGFGQDDGSRETAPQFLVDAEVVASKFGGEVLVAARLYYEEIDQSFHVDADRERTPLHGPTQKLSVLQSELKRFSINTLQFKTVDGKTLTSDDVKASLAKNNAVLLLPEGAELHPSIKALLKPDTIIISKVKGPRPRKLIPRPTRR